MKGCKRSKIYSILMLQLKETMLMITSPKTFIKNMEMQQNIKWLHLLIILMLNISINYYRQGEYHSELLIELLLSIVLFSLFLMIIIQLAKGKIKLVTVINLSLSIHIFYILKSMSQVFGILALLAYAIHYYTIKMQFDALTLLFECDRERTIYICWIEAIIIGYGWLSCLMQFFGYQLLYLERIFYFPLVT